MQYRAQQSIRRALHRLLLNGQMRLTKAWVNHKDAGMWRKGPNGQAGRRKSYSGQKPRNCGSQGSSQVLSQRFKSTHSKPGAGPASKFKGGGEAISVILGSQSSLRVCYCKRDEVHFTALLWQNNGRQNGLVSRM